MRACVILICLVAMTAGADADKQKAADLFAAGEQAYKMSNFIGAAQNFEAAFQELPAPEIAFSAAQAYRLQFQIDQKPHNAKRAIELYEIYVKANGKGKRAGDAATHLDNLRAAYRDLVAAGKATDDAIAVERTQVSVWVPIEGATVTIDGSRTDAYAYFDVAPGDHTVAVEAEGYLPFSQKVSVARGAKVPVPVELAARPATLHVDTDAGARISVDGRLVRATGGALEVPAGKRFITITRRGRKPFSREIEARPGATLNLEAKLETTGQRRAARWALLGAGVLAGLTVATSTVTLIAQGKAQDLIDVRLEDSAAYTTWRDRRNTFRTASIVLGSATVLAAGAAVALYLFDNPGAEGAPAMIEPAKPGDVTFTPMGLADGAGISVEGAW